MVKETLRLGADRTVDLPIFRWVRTHGQWWCLVSPSHFAHETRAQRDLSGTGVTLFGMINFVDFAVPASQRSGVLLHLDLR